MKKKWTQNQFDKDHIEPHEYGEGDWYVIGSQYTIEQSAKIIAEWESNLTGEPSKVTTNDIRDIPIAIGKNEDNEADWIVDMLAQTDIWGKGVCL